jgi:hypothetical protein
MSRAFPALALAGAFLLLSLGADRVLRLPATNGRTVAVLTTLPASPAAPTPSTPPAAPPSAGSGASPASPDAAATPSPSASMSLQASDADDGATLPAAIGDRLVLTLAYAPEGVPGYWAGLQSSDDSVVALVSACSAEGGLCYTFIADGPGVADITATFTADCTQGGCPPPHQFDLRLDVAG